METRTNAGRRVRKAVVVALIVAGLWAGTAVTRGMARGEDGAPNGPMGHISRAVQVIRG
ncbi:hypothetical protein [Streptomyces sp. NPDC003077]|uniref:hypothetical protein n=1 Tax=Streptomyces sp. NPDC003077 TaxID=3154443 RepID=UPI0033A58774